MIQRLLKGILARKRVAEYRHYLSKVVLMQRFFKGRYQKKVRSSHLI